MEALYKINLPYCEQALNNINQNDCCVLGLSIFGGSTSILLKICYFFACFKFYFSGMRVFFIVSSTKPHQYRSKSMFPSFVLTFFNFLFIWKLQWNDQKLNVQIRLLQPFRHTLHYLMVRIILDHLSNANSVTQSYSAPLKCNKNMQFWWHWTASVEHLRESDIPLIIQWLEWYKIGL